MATAWPASRGRSRGLSMGTPFLTAVERAILPPRQPHSVERPAAMRPPRPSIGAKSPVPRTKDSPGTTLG
ncbi:hypothetical protein T484DRAFT_1979845 [Baffinella frigidus]|nr:hypothetical protein T484DRAFT_1979845 [Cryptophyta sp. CCMP2293]